MDMASRTIMSSIATGTGEAAVPSSALMSMHRGSMGKCKISMLWNWYTVGACFISPNWQITSPGMFGGSCVGIALLVMLMSFLRKLHRSYDASIVRSRHTAPETSCQGQATPGSSAESSEPGSNGDQEGNSGDNATRTRFSRLRTLLLSFRRNSLRPKMWQQFLRAILHATKFAVAYFVMLLAMYFNGYIIISIFIGSFLGYFFFDWDTLQIDKENVGTATEVTGCCG